MKTLLFIACLLALSAKAQQQLTLVPNSVVEAVWTPASVPNLLSWWKASSITGVADAVGVALWTGDFGTNNFIQTTSGARPKYRANWINGLPATTYDGSRYFVTTNNLGMQGSNTLTIFWVGTNGPTKNFVLSSLGSYTANNNFRLLHNSTNLMQVDDYPGGLDSFITAKSVETYGRNEDNTWNVYTVCINRPVGRATNCLNNHTWLYANGAQWDGANAQSTYRNDTRAFTDAAFSNPLDTTYYAADKIHLTTLANGVVATNVAAALNALGFH